MSGRRFIFFIKTIVLVCILLAMPPMHASAQGGRTVRQVNRFAWQGQGGWYDSSTAMYQVRYPILPFLPPVSDAMPAAIQRIYERLDRAARSDDSRQTEREITHGGRLNAAWAIMARDLYKLADYNPIIFRQYLDETHLQAGTYVMRVPSLVSAVQDMAFRTARAVPGGRALYSLLSADYILRVRISAVDSMPTKPPAKGKRIYRFRVTAEVLDTLKGLVLPPCNGPNTSGSSSCIQFQYTHDHYFNPNEFTGDGPWLYSTKDPAFTTGSDSAFALHAGQEAVVFLTHHGEWIDDANDYYNLDLEPGASYNALPVVDGKVRDINTIWSASTLTPYALWRSMFLQARERLLRGMGWQ